MAMGLDSITRPGEWSLVQIIELPTRSPSVLLAVMSTLIWIQNSLAVMVARMRATALSTPLMVVLSGSMRKRSVPSDTLLMTSGEISLAPRHTVIRAVGMQAWAAHWDT